MKNYNGAVSALFMVGSIVGVFLLGWFDQPAKWVLLILALYALTVIIQGRPNGSKEFFRSALFVAVPVGLIGGVLYFLGRMLG